MSRGRDVIIVGAGIIGLAIGWRCAQRGLAVTIVDPAPGSGASWTAAGMLAPVTELHYEGRELFALSLDSAGRFPSWAAELHDVAGLDVGYRTCGTVQVAWDAADLAVLRDMHAFHAMLGVPSELLTSRDLRAAEPALAAGLPGGLFAAGDHQVDNRVLHEALMVAARSAGARIINSRVGTVNVTNNRVAGVRNTDGSMLAADTVVLAAGAWSRTVHGLPPSVVPPVRPVKGQTLRLRGPVDLLTHVVRGSVKGNHVYVVPRPHSGEIVIGASSEEAGFDVRPRAGAVYELLRDAQSLVPELSEAEFVEVCTSVRPGSPDNAPLLGATGLDGLFVATGHYRNGILLAPVTGDEIAALIATGTISAAIAAFDPRRSATTSEVHA